MRWIVAVAATAILGISCGGADEPTVDTAHDQPYSIVDDDTYGGVKFFDESVEPYNAYPELDGWISAPPNPVGNEYGSMQVDRRTIDGGREDLVVMYTKPDNLGVDGLRLTGDTTDVHLILSCEGTAALLIENGDIAGDRDVSEASRAWRPGTGGALEEFDPGEVEPQTSCVREGPYRGG